MAERKQITGRTLQKGLPDSEFVCGYFTHVGKIPSHWEIDHKCRANNCPWLMIESDFQKWIKKRNVIVY